MVVAFYYEQYSNTLRACVCVYYCIVHIKKLQPENWNNLQIYWTILYVRFILYIYENLLHLLRKQLKAKKGGKSS